MEAPIRVLEIVTNMARGGIETMLMNYDRNIDQSAVQLDFLVHRAERAVYDDEIEALGGRIYRVPRLNPISPAYHKSLIDFFSSHREYKVVHCHLDCVAGIPLQAALHCGVPVRIAHAHSSNQSKDFRYPLKIILKRNIAKTATHLFACGEKAGHWMFGKSPFVVMRNTIQTERFSFKENVRCVMRKKLFPDRPDAFVVGHVGSFWPPKNHTFLLDIFYEVHKQKPNAVLLLAGTGGLMDAVQKKAQRLGLSDSVKLLGDCGDVYNIMQAMDVFVLPSLFEGLPVTMVEAQAAGLPCVISDRVPTECIVTEGLVSVKRLSDTPQEWTKCILSSAAIPRTDRTAEIRASGFDVAEAAKWLEGFYIEAYTRACADHLHPDL